MTDDLTTTLSEVVARLNAAGIDYMLVGSLAALAHGRPRSTQDLDLVVRASGAQLDALVHSLPEDRFYASREAARDALRSQTLFNVIDMLTGWKVDLIPLKRREFSRVEFERRRRSRLLGQDVWVASLEDTVVAKLEWSKLASGSGRQLEDVRELLRVAGDRLDHEYVQRWVTELQLEAEWALAQTLP